jgi:hypothetical protein
MDVARPLPKFRIRNFVTHIFTPSTSLSDVIFARCLTEVVGEARTGNGSQPRSVTLTTKRAPAMNARTNLPELDRIRRDIGARLRIEYEVAEPPPLLVALLKELEIHEHDVEGQRLFAQVEARVAELLRAAGR